MDTVESLNGGYFYKGLFDLSAHELLFWVMIDEIQKQLGVEDIIGAAFLLLGTNSIEVPGKMSTATKGTSHASLFFRQHLSYKFKKRILPTLTNTSFSMRGLKIFWVNNLGAFVGRAVPVLGWIILAKDVSLISYNTVNHYNKLVRKEDRIW
ncbi:hypothetical protein SNN58_002859 [Cronobacter dublinensis]|nr:hypothetical protein [Cronobacter dublinensis]ELY3969926.1 hypothetical protein [Cronobacter dublinensis]ELY4486334.1 hypothetical protein [Cronobacter dublinensis]ELY5824335.1 hypothetical protein [Cronobacter dublinensis]